MTLFEHRLAVPGLFPEGFPDRRFVYWAREIREHDMAMQGRDVITFETAEDRNSFLRLLPEFTPPSGS